MVAHDHAGDSITLFEALYDLEKPRASWFRGVLACAGRVLDRGAGVGMLLYDVSGTVPVVEAIAGSNLSQENIKVGADAHATAEWERDILNAYRTEICATLDEHVRCPRVRAALRARYQPLGIVDQVLINGGNPSGIGCAMFVFSRTALQLAPLERELLTRTALHLSAAYRLQRRLEGAHERRPDAVLTANGRCEHAESSASSLDSRRLLVEAVHRREWARTAFGRKDRKRATEAWKPLVSGRWTLVDHFERDGQRYITARENVSEPRGLSALSGRERQVTALALMGRSNKEIAYELGLSHSTVRVLLARAAAKMGVRTRAALLERASSAASS